MKKFPEAIFIRVPPATRAEIEAAAESEQRSVAGLVRVILTDWQRRRTAERAERQAA